MIKQGKKNTDCVIDIETTALTPDAGLVSVGLAFYNWKTLELGSTYQIQFKKCEENTLRAVDHSVLDWWASDKVDDVAREQMLKYHDDKSWSLMEGLIMIQKLIDDNCSESCKVWGNGSIFDITILENAYKQCGLKEPWYFRCVNDVRTALRTFKRFGIKTPTMAAMSATGHVAMNDAIHEREVLVTGFKALDDIAEKAKHYDEIISDYNTLVESRDFTE